MNIWNYSHKTNIISDEKVDIGLHLFFRHGISKVFRREFRDFCQWLQENYAFPIAINVTITNYKQCIMENGEKRFGIFKYAFFNEYPIFDKSMFYPTIRLPAKGYSINWSFEEIAGSFVHELSHYFQWIQNISQDELSSERQANYYRYRIVDLYLKMKGD